MLCGYLEVNYLLCCCLEVNYLLCGCLEVNYLLCGCLEVNYFCGFTAFKTRVYFVYIIIQYNVNRVHDNMLIA